MNDEEIHKILKLVLDRIKDEKIVWRVEGSANLRILGLDVDVNDLDLVTDRKGIEVFKEKLKDFFVLYETEKFDHPRLMLEIFGKEVEINDYEDENYSMFQKVKKLEWQGLNLNILPLESAKVFYELINRPEKVELIERYLKSRKKRL